MPRLFFYYFILPPVRRGLHHTSPLSFYYGLDSMSQSSTFFLHSYLSVAMIVVNESHFLFGKQCKAKTNMKNYRIAIIGLGGMGGAHADAVQLEENCELVAGAEINPERAKAWSERFGVKAIYDDYEKMLDQEQPDIVHRSNASTDASSTNDRCGTARHTCFL